MSGGCKLQCHLQGSTVPLNTNTQIHTHTHTQTGYVEMTELRHYSPSDSRWSVIILLILLTGLTYILYHTQ